jgi:hypothetical protein
MNMNYLVKQLGLNIEIPRDILASIAIISGNIKADELDFNGKYYWDDLGYVPENFNYYGEPSQAEVEAQSWENIIRFINEQIGLEIKDKGDLFVYAMVKFIAAELVKE